MFFFSHSTNCIYSPAIAQWATVSVFKRGAITPWNDLQLPAAQMEPIVDQSTFLVHIKLRKREQWYEQIIAY